MRNWLGQDILPGSVVYRGAREGNSSSYKVGVVESIKDGKARVHWQYEPGWAWRRTAAGVNERVYDVPNTMNSKGNPAVDSLILMDEIVMSRLEEACKLIERWKQDDQMRASDLRFALDNLAPV